MNGNSEELCYRSGQEAPTSHTGGIQSYSNGVDSGRCSGKKWSKGGRERKERSGGNEAFPLGKEKILALRQDMKNGLGPIELLKRIASGGGFYARLEVVEESPEEIKNAVLEITAAAAKIRFKDIREMAHGFLERVSESPLIKVSCNRLQSMAYSLNQATEKRFLAILNPLLAIIVEIHNRIPAKILAFSMEIAVIFLLLQQEGVKKLLAGNIQDEEGYSERFMAIYRNSIGQEERKDEKKTAAYVPSSEEEEPPQSFRDIDVFPSRDEILSSTKPFLRKNVVDGAYANVEHYLDVQFRLLREDYLHDLREGVGAIDGKANDRRNNNDLSIWRGVRIGSPKVDKRTGVFVRDVRFESNQRIHWDFNQRLIFGSLLCFSSDEFKEELIFGIVMESSPRGLSRGIFQVKIENETPRIDQDYVMAESKAYFEAYRHVLEGLQAIQPHTMPFQQYLVFGETEIKSPRYLWMNRKINFEPLLKGEITGTKERDVLVDSQWPTAEQLGLDLSQWQALKTCLTKELAVIQGPPGTGKTYIGWQLAKLLLHESNCGLWNPDDQRPMLVVCYTNHALDQFLEGLMQFMTEGIVRVGSRSKNDAMDPVLLNNIRAQNRGTQSFEFRRAFFEQKRLEEELDNLVEELGLLQTEIPQMGYLTSKIVEEALGIPTDQLNPLHSDATLLKWLSAEFQEMLNSRRNINLDALQVMITENDVEEMLAKKALFMTGNENPNKAMTWIYENQGSSDLLRIPREVKKWPMLDDVYTLAEQMGLTNEFAAHALATNKNSLEKATEWINAAFQNLNLPEEVGVKRDEADEDDEEVQQALVGDRARMNDQEDGLMKLWLEERKNDMAQNAHSGKGQESEVTGYFLPPKLVERLVDGPVLDGRGCLTKEASIYWVDFKMRVRRATPMTSAQAGRVEDIWKLRLEDRWKLFNHWIWLVFEKLKKQIGSAERKYSAAAMRVHELRGVADMEILKSARVIGMTTTCAARYQAMLQSIGPPIVIMEEAAEVLEAHLVTALSPQTQHAILIGDHKQLRPNPTVYELARHFNLDVSLFERLVKNGFHHSQLQLQHRMRPEISQTLMPHFYDDLEDDPSVMGMDNVPGITKNFVFFNHGHSEQDEYDNRSRRNLFEAELAVALAIYLVQHEIEPQHITLLSCYKAQFFEIRSRVSKQFWLKGIRQAVLDNYQGEENDVIILSLVRSNRQKVIGFLGIDNRVCVALSRAKKGLYCLGNFDLLGSKTDTWQGLVESARREGALQRELVLECPIHDVQNIVTDGKEIAVKCPEGGCLAFCRTQMECGHICEKRCHSYDRDHVIIKCYKPCERMCKAGLHPCRKLCYEDCGDCNELVMKDLPCGHSREGPCYMSPEEMGCPEPCERLLACGHQCQNRCSEPHTLDCLEWVVKLLPCSHVRKVACYLDPAEVLCRTLMMKELPCGHKSEIPCCEDPLSFQCKEPCGLPLPDCGHICEGTCWGCRRGRLHIRCQKDCEKILICGHACNSKCGRTCPPCQKLCETQCPHIKCGSQGRPKVGRRRGAKGGRRCGEPCPPCQEMCEWNCKHHKCKLNCFAACVRPRCFKPCKEKLQCTKTKGRPHKRRCVGVCGEKCPDICKDCQPREFEELMKTVAVGDGEECRFIQLDDCRCIVEVKMLDSWIDRQAELAEGKLKPMVCPMCSSRINKSLRYGPELKQRMRDVQLIKLKVKGDPEVLDSQRETLVETIDNVLEAVKGKAGVGQIHCNKLGLILRDRIKQPDVRDLSRYYQASWQNLWTVIKAIVRTELGFLTFVVKNSNVLVSTDFTETFSLLQGGKVPILSEKAPPGYGGSPLPIVNAEIISLIDWLKRNVESTSYLMQKQFASEGRRLTLLADVFILLMRISTSKDKLTESDIASADASCARLLERMDGEGELVDTLEEELRESLGTLQKQFGVGPGLPHRERIPMRKSIGLGQDFWRKCQNGHLRAIDEQSGVTQTDVCQMCVEKLGEAMRRVDLNSSNPPDDGACQ